MFYDRYSRRGGDLDDLLLILQEREKNAVQALSGDHSQSFAAPVSNLLRFIPYTLRLLQSWLPFGVRTTTESAGQPAISRQQSALLSKLPPEIRQLIWQEVLGRRLLHIARAKKRLVAIDCPVQCSVQQGRVSGPCWGLLDRNTRLFPGYYLRPWPGSMAIAGGLLALPRTCRAIYSETVEILYKENTFDFNHLESLIDLPKTILPQRLALIHSLRLCWTFTLPFVQEVPSRLVGLPADLWPPPPYDASTWGLACEAIACMRGLKIISMNLSCLSDVFYHDPANYNFEPILRPLYEVRDAAIFEIELDQWIRLTNFEPPPDAPFKVFYPQED